MLNFRTRAGAFASATVPLTDSGNSSALMQPVRLDALTGLRIVAALAVYLSHTPIPQGFNPQLTNIMAAGGAGVTVFFVLSGFVLSYMYFEVLRCPTVGAVWSFVVARVARIYPVYLLVLASVVIFDPMGLFRDTGGWGWHAIGLQAWGPNPSFSQSFNGAAWSVSVELFLYAMLPLLIPLIAKLDRGMIWLVMTGAAPVFAVGLVTTVFWLDGRMDLPRWDPNSAYRWLYIHPFARLGDFIFGIVLARLYLRLAGRPGVDLVGSICSLVLIATTLLITAVRPSILQPFRYDLTYMLLGGFLILSLALSPRAPVSRLLAWAPVVLLGEASYALYLLHWPWMAKLGAGTWAATGTATGLAHDILVLCVLVGLALLVHFAIERPSRRLLRGSLAARRLPITWQLSGVAKRDTLDLATIQAEMEAREPHRRVST